MARMFRLRGPALVLAGASLAGAAFGAETVDFAEFEHSGKCPELLQAATGYEAIKDWTQDKLDNVYACAKAGPMPNGFMHGRVIFAAGGNFERFAAYAASLGVPIDKNAFKAFAEGLWKGKHFYRDEGALLNKLGADLQPLLGQNVAGQMRFPAALYCGQSLLDSRRESNIIDYAFTENVKVGGRSPYNDQIDWIATGRTSTGKTGLKVRDEIRMLRPGFYLGRAHMDRVFALNFTLTADQPEGGEDTCFPGY